MKILSLIIAELVGLFVDDEFLALSVLGVVLVSAGFSFWPLVSPMVIGAIVLLGCLGVLALSLARAVRK
jgi:hydrogenase/urease accessory protein HupE